VISGAVIVIVMGVSGAGKTTVGEALAAALGWEFHDGDDLHPAGNKRKMRRGLALDDADRWPWLAGVRALVERHLADGSGAVIACSALKQTYRDAIVADPERVKIVYLHGVRGLIAQRLRHRRGHFMPPALLESQLAALDEPSDALTVDIAAAPDEIVGAIRARLGI
jgi:gluconokinase